MANVGIGDEKYVLLRETVALPKSRAEIVHMVRAELNKGGIRKMIIELDEPVRIIRAVTSDSVEARALSDLPDLDLIDSVRNAPVEGLPTAGKKELAYREAFMAFDVLARKHVQPRAFLAHQFSVIRNWLGLSKETDVTRIFGLPVRTSPAIDNDDHIILVGTSDDPDEVVLSIVIQVN